MLKKTIVKVGKRMLAVFVLLTAPLTVLWAQEANEKFSVSTQMFLNELKEKAEKPVTKPRQVSKFKLSEELLRKKPQRLIASPDTVAGVAYISCFIHLKDANDLSEVHSLGVEIEETFDGLNFVTARVPVNQLERLATIENVTLIKVAERMQLMSDVARQKTNVDDLLKLSSDAVAQGITNKYDGTGVILGIIDTGIDFQHIAFKDKNGNSRIKRAYVYDGSSGTEYTSITSSSPTTDNAEEDHGTHTASTAGGSSVIVNGSTVTVTDNHANATYGGMAPGADLYLAGVKGLYNTYISNALSKIVSYANAQGKPLVVSNSWGSHYGPHDGTGELADLVGMYFGDDHPNRAILFSSSNDAGNSKGKETGGYFVKKTSASSSSPLGTILRSVTDASLDGGCLYAGNMSIAWSPKALNCKIHVLDSSTGAVKKSWTVTSSTSSFDGLDTYYDGNLTVLKESKNGKYSLRVYSNNRLISNSLSTTTKNGSTYYLSGYILAVEVYPSSDSGKVDMWAGDYTYFTSHLTTSSHTWTAGTDDMCASDQATIPNAISVGAYVSKTNWTDAAGSSHSSENVYTMGDIAYFSSYATAAQSPTGLAYPWITAPGARLAAGVNHYHNTSVDDYSYYGNYSSDLVVNNSNSPYAMMEGTSMATPVAAGIVALWLQAAQSVNKSLTVNDVKTIMAQTAIKDSYTTTGSNASHFGKGKIDALAGIKYILENEIEHPEMLQDGDLFTARTEENVNMTFKVISAADKTCQVGARESTGVVTIGESASGTTHSAPYDNYYKYSTVQMLYTPAEVGQEGKITKIAYKVAASSSCPTTSVKIYMGHKSGTFSGVNGYVSSNNLTLVYSGSPTLGASTGWETLTLNQNSFTYNGTDNLVVVITKSCSEYISGLTYSCFTGSGYTLYRQNDSDTSYADITNTSLPYFTSTNRPSVRFTIESLPVAIPTTTRGIVTIPSTANNYKVVSIGVKAFNNCTNVSGVKIPGTVSSIQGNAFYGCTGILGVTSKIRFPFAVASSVFNSIPTNATLYVPYGSKERYESTSGWNGFGNIVEMEPEDGDVFTAKTDEDVDMTFKIASTSDMTCRVTTGNDSVSTFVPSIPSATPDHVTIPEDVNGFTITGIDSHAFSDCNALASVSIPSNVSSIGDAVFEGCDNLVSVYIDVATPVTISESVFPNRANATLHVPAGSKSAYEKANYWKEFKVIKEMPDKINNAIELADALGCRGGLVVQPVILKNTQGIVGFQFDLMLSEGVSLAQDANGKYLATLTDRKADHLLSVNKVDEGIYRFVSISMNNSEFSGTEGTVLSVKLMVDESVASGTYNVEVKKTELITAIMDNIYSVKNTSTLTVQDAEPGDVNGDFSVSVTDVTGIIGYILNDPPAIFIEYAAHMNDDRKISVTDAVIVIDKILHAGVNTQNRAPRQTGPEPQ